MHADFADQTLFNEGDEEARRSAIPQTPTPPGDNDAIMIQALSITHVARNSEDFDLLVSFLNALGVGGGKVSNGGRAKAATFFPSDVRFHVVAYKEDFRLPDLYLNVSDARFALSMANKLGLTVDKDASETIEERGFRALLPGGTVILVGGPSHLGQFDKRIGIGISGDLRATGKRFAIVVSRFNSFITDRLVESTFDGLMRCGVKEKDIHVVRVPGAFEIPSAARTLALTGRYDALICIGCLLRGDTAHYDVIVNEVTRGIGQSAQETGVPHAFGVLTCDTLEQAIDRAGLKMGNKGFEAALAAVEMASLKNAVSSQRSAVSKKKSHRPTQGSGNPRRRNAAKKKSK